MSNPLHPFPEADFLGLPLADPGVEGFIDWITARSPKRSEPAAIAYLNAHTVNLACRQGVGLRPRMERMDLLYPDGMSVVRALRRRGFPVSERVSAADFFPEFCWSAAGRKRSLALIGGLPGVAAKCARAMKDDVPGLRIRCTRHGYFSEEEEEKLVRRLKTLRPAITLVGMGSPRQERIALRLRDEALLPTVWCVGALFEYYAPGVRRHAPLWMRQAGLEWVFRLSQEPRRLAVRYLTGNIEFLLRSRGWIGKD